MRESTATGPFAACLLILALWAPPAVLTAQTEQPQDALRRQAGDGGSRPSSTARQLFRPLDQIRVQAAPESELLPPNRYAHRTPQRAPLPARVVSSHDMLFAYHWTPSGLVHNPLYFEDVPLERYGQGYSPLLQPLVSGAKFYGNIAILPYRIGLDPPHAMNYSLGYDRPGSYAAPVRPHLPWSWKGALLQAGFLTGGVFMFP